MMGVFLISMVVTRNLKKLKITINISDITNKIREMGLPH